MKIKYQAGTVMPDEYDYVRDFNALDTTIPYTEMDTGKVLGLAIAHQQKDAEIAGLKQELLAINIDVLPEKDRQLDEKDAEIARLQDHVWQLEATIQRLIEKEG